MLLYFLLNVYARKTINFSLCSHHVCTNNMLLVNVYKNNVKNNDKTIRIKFDFF